MNDFLMKVRQSTLDFGMPQPPEKILAAVSGGADSVSLMIALESLGYRVYALHVEHGIRGQESLDDAGFVEKLCHERGIPFVLRHIDAPSIARESGETLEEAARRVRYRIIEETALELGIFTAATAHHQDDQAETVLWNLVRGSGIAGLCGMRPSRTLGKKVSLIRPLLRCGRDEIEAYLTSIGQDWRVDRTNMDPAYTRNDLRLNILPELHRLNEKAAQHIAAASGELAAIDDYLSEQASGHYSCIVTKKPDGEVVINRRELLQLNPVIMSRVLHSALGEAAGTKKDMTRRHIEALADLAVGKTGRRVQLPGGLRAVCEDSVLRLTRALPGTTEKEVAIDHEGVYYFPSGSGDGELRVTVRYGIWNGGEIPKNKYTKMLSYDTITPCMVLRTRRSGDWLTVNASGGRRSLKNYMIDEKIPREKRGSIPLITQGSHVLWAVGMRISEDAKVRNGSHFAMITVDGMESTEEMYEREHKSTDT